VVACNDSDVVVAATREGHVLLCKADEIASSRPGRGVTRDQTRTTTS